MENQKTTRCYRIARRMTATIKIGSFCGICNLVSCSLNELFCFIYCHFCIKGSLQ